MKHNYFISIFVCIFLNVSAESSLLTVAERLNTFPETEQQQSIEKAAATYISSGNSQMLASLFFSAVELTLPDVRGSYSKAQTELLMKNFFSKHPPKSFSVINEGQSAGEKSKFVIGTYASESQNTFRVYYLIKEISGKNQITILKFE